MPIGYVWQVSRWRCFGDDTSAFIRLMGTGNGGTDALHSFYDTHDLTARRTSRRDDTVQVLVPNQARLGQRTYYI